MPRLAPIRAIRYQTSTGDVSSRIAPPYDVLDEQPKQKLLQRDPHNIVAVDLPVTPPKTVGPNEKYAEAGELLRRWLDEGVLKKQEHPAIYAYEQVYTVNERTFRRRGLFGGLGVEEFGRPNGGIHRHEHTIKAGTDDRYKLMEATGAQLSPVFGVFHDAHARVAEMLGRWFDGREPDLFGTTENDGVEHRVWVVDDVSAIEQLIEFFEGTDVFIADGHHRYTTALNYHKDHPDETGAAACLFVLVAVEDPGMIVLPTHRVITGLADFSLEKLHAVIADRDDLEIGPTSYGRAQLDQLAVSLPEVGHHAMGLYDPASGRTDVLSATTADPLLPHEPDKPVVWRQLDVAILQHLVVERVLKPAFGEEVAYKYTADLDEAAEMAEAEPGRLAVIMQPTPLESVCAVSIAGEVMPPKSTFFYPKLATGLVINPLR